MILLGFLLIFAVFGDDVVPENGKIKAVAIDWFDSNHFAGRQLCSLVGRCTLSCRKASIVFYAGVGA